MIKPRDATRRDLRGFALGLAAVFCVFAWIAWRDGSPRLPVCLGLAGTLGAAAALLPEAVRPVYFLWYPFARLLGAVNSFLLLGLVYYLMLTPYALLLRLFAAGPLELGFDGKKSSYWTAKEPSGSAEALERMF